MGLHVTREAALILNDDRSDPVGLDAIKER
jgi:hypothetical protein